MKRLFLLFAMLCLLTGSAFAHTEAHVFGHIVDDETGEHIPFVTVMVKGSSVGTTTDVTGHYFLKNLKEGKTVLVVRYVGYQTEEVTVDVNTMKMTIAETYPDKLWVIGDAVGGWTFEDGNILVACEQSGVYTWTGDLAQGELKFYDGPSFDDVAYGAEGEQTPFQTGDLTLTKLSDGNDFKFYVESAQAGNYTLTVDLKSMKLHVEKNNAPSTGVETVEAAGWVQESYGIVCNEARAMALYDISGRKVASANATLLPFDALNTGVYVLVIETAQGRSTHKIVIR